MRIAQLLLPILVALGAASAVPANATTVLPVEFADMARDAPIIVHGTVIDVQSRMDAGRRSIESFVTVAIIDAIKGVAGTHVVFRVPNGQVGRYRRITVGAPEFTEGDEVVLFLGGRAPAVPTPFGLNQGVYRVTRRPGAATVTPLVPDAAGRVVRGDPARRPLTIEAFTRAVRAALEPR